MTAGEGTSPRSSARTPKPTSTLATGVKGLELMYPNNPWIDDFFQGVALILAVSLSVLAPAAAQRKRAKRAAEEQHAAPSPETTSAH
jgi:hypothetical protein